MTQTTPAKAPTRAEDLLIQAMIDQSVLTERITQLEERMADVTAQSIKAEIAELRKTLARLNARAQA